MYRGSAGGPSSGMDYDPLPMNIYDSKGKKSKKSSGLAIAHLCSPMGAVITLFALAVWACIAVYMQKLGLAKQLKESQQELSGTVQLHRMLDTQHKAAVNELSSHKGVTQETHRILEQTVSSLEKDVKRLTQVETSLNHQLRMEKEAMLKLTQAHDEATAELEVKQKEIQELHEKLQQQQQQHQDKPVTDDSEARLLKKNFALQERTEALAAEKTDLEGQLTDLQRQLSASQAELAACFGTLEEATTTRATPDHSKPAHMERANRFKSFHKEPAPKPEADDAVELTKHVHSEHVEVERHEQVPAPDAQLEAAEAEDVEEETHVPEPHFDPEGAAETPEEPAHEVAEAHPAVHEVPEAQEPAPTEKVHKPHKMNAMDMALGMPKHHDEAR